MLRPHVQNVVHKSTYTYYVKIIHKNQYYTSYLTYSFINEYKKIIILHAIKKKYLLGAGILTSREAKQKCFFLFDETSTSKM